MVGPPEDGAGAVDKPPSTEPWPRRWRAQSPRRGVAARRRNRLAAPQPLRARSGTAAEPSQMSRRPRVRMMATGCSGCRPRRLAADGRALFGGAVPAGTAAEGLPHPGARLALPAGRDRHRRAARRDRRDHRGQGAAHAGCRRLRLVGPPAPAAGADRRDLYRPASRLDRPTRPLRHDAGDARPLAAPSGGCLAGRFLFEPEQTGTIRGIRLSTLGRICSMSALIIGNRPRTEREQDP